MRFPRFKLAHRKAHPAARVLATLFGALVLVLGVHFFLSNVPNVHQQWPLFAIMGIAMLWAGLSGYWPGDRGGSST